MPDLTGRVRQFTATASDGYLSFNDARPDRSGARHQPRGDHVPHAASTMPDLTGRVRLTRGISLMCLTKIAAFREPFKFLRIPPFTDRSLGISNCL